MGLSTKWIPLSWIGEGEKGAQKKKNPTSLHGGVWSLLVGWIRQIVRTEHGQSGLQTLPPCDTALLLQQH